MSLKFLLIFLRHRNFPVVKWKSFWTQDRREPPTFRLWTRCSTTAPLQTYKQTQWQSVCFLLGFSGRFCSYRKPNFPAVSGSYLPEFSGRICSYWQPDFPAVSGSYLPGFSGRICSYWQPNFPAVSVVTCWDFLALPFLAPEGRDFPAVSVVSGPGRIFRP